MTAPDARQPEELREVLRAHHPIMRSETGPLSGCRCGQVKLGQDVIAHVADAITAWHEKAAESLARERAAEELRAAAQEQRNEAKTVPDTDEGTHADGHRCAADWIDRRAARAAALTAEDQPVQP